MIDDASPGASLAACITRICSGGTMAKVAAPNSNTPSAAVAWLMKASGSTNINRARTASRMRVEPSSDQSAMRPPMPLPTVKPIPISASDNAMKALDAPVSSVNTGAT
ncbi:hypothetical protein D3C81_1143670 [compost metagenome]